VQVAAKVHDQKTIIAILCEVAQHKRLWPENGTVHAARLLGTKDRVFTPPAQQVSMQGIDLGMGLPFGEIELAALERPGIRRVGEASLRFGQGQAPELGKECGTAATDQLGQVCLMIRKK